MISSQDKEIQALVSDIKEGKLLLPEMQRGYVWKSIQVRDLFDSLYHNYPSGQLLVWETEDLPHSRATSLGGVTAEGRHPQLLLDGQQRLTSLAAVMLGTPLQVRDFNKPIDIVFNLLTEQFAVAGVQHRGEGSRWISLTKLYTKGAMSVIMDIKLDPSDPEAQQIFERLTRLDNIKRYKYRVIVIEKLSYNEVTHIFVRINSGGTTLNTADLALAQISSRWRGVTQELDAYLQKVAQRGLEMDVGILLRAMAVFLTGQSSPSLFFRRERQDISVDELKAVWERVKHSLDRAISFIVSNCLIDQLGMLTTNYVLVPLAAYFDRFGDAPTPEQLRQLQRWVYMALLWNRYSGASETGLEQDVAALKQEQPIQAMVRNLEDKIGVRRLVTERDLQGQRKNSSAMLMAYVVARHNDATDLFTGMALDGSQNMEFQHIFPKTVLRGRYSSRKDSLIIDQVANLVFITNSAAARAGHRAPEKYLPELDAGRLRTQHVPLDPALWSIDSFEQFLVQRRTLLAEAINKLLILLTEDPALWPTSDKQIMESRVDALEHQFRDLINDRLSEDRGEQAWEQRVPKDVQNAIRGRIEQRLQSRPQEAGQYETLESRLRFCQFSDYPKMVRVNWSLFEDIFGKPSAQPLFEQHAKAVITARNAFKHNNELSRSDLASAEAGLIWLEERMQVYQLLQNNEDIEEDTEAAPA
ncbi:MAG: DUF262 domain-containing protein [Oscillochloris sp.]|nr:DUF262 domain-containing protein [Oscillochloris sp.]